MTESLFIREPGVFARVWGNRSRNDWIPPTSTVASVARHPVVRLPTGLPWLDPMLGGGFVRGSVVMVHGEPGSGKSTALAQAACAIRGAFYVTAEEAASSVAARVLRLGLRDTLELIESRNIHEALAAAGRAPLVVIDSIQVIGDPVEATKAAVDHARQNNVCVVIVCHETKSGVHGGPRLLEHLVDTTIRIGRGPPRSIITEKNRHGPAGISLLLQMTEKGLTV